MHVQSYIFLMKIEFILMHWVHSCRLITRNLMWAKEEPIRENGTVSGRWVGTSYYSSTPSCICASRSSTWDDSTTVLYWLSKRPDFFLLWHQEVEIDWNVLTIIGRIGVICYPQTSRSASIKDWRLFLITGLIMPDQNLCNILQLSAKLITIMCYCYH